MAASGSTCTCRREEVRTMTLRVLVCDDQGLVRAGFAKLIDATEGLTVVGEAADGAEAVAQARRLLPDVVLMDIRMPVLDGISATSTDRGRARHPGTGPGADDVRDRRVRRRRTARGRQWVPPQGRPAGAAGGGDPGHCPGRCPARPGRHAIGDHRGGAARRPEARRPRSPRRPDPARDRDPRARRTRTLQHRDRGRGWSSARPPSKRTSGTCSPSSVPAIGCRP